MSRFGPRLVMVGAIILIALLASLFVFAEAGYMRLSTLNVRISDVQKRQTTLARLLRLVSDGESSQRGFLLVGDERYLEPLRALESRWPGVLEDLAEDYRRAGISNAGEMQELRSLMERRFQQFEHSIALYRGSGPAAGMEFVRSGAGKKTMDELRAEIGELQTRESHALLDVISRWQADLQALRVLMAAAVLLNILLVTLAAFLMHRQLRRGATQTSELQEQVRMNVNELAALSSHLQHVAEREKKTLSRDLHDALGGLLVGTKMDVAWIRNRLGGVDPAIELRFQRIQRSLDESVDFKRRVVEQLRPTLLDNMGLFAALRWQFQEACSRASLKCDQVLPQQELILASDAAIGLFRVAQEALTNMLKHAHASAAWLEVEVTDQELLLRVADNGRGISGQAQTRGGHGLTSMRHRVIVLGGMITIRAREAGGTEVLVRLPLSRILASAQDADNMEVAAADVPLARTD